MSVKELKLVTEQGNKISIKFEDGEFEIENDNGNDYHYFWLDCSQAHLLMLYLQEHLK